MRRSQEQRRLTTTTALLVAGRRLFGAYGYAEVSSARLAATARVTTGAMYYHYESKAALFRSVFEAVEADLAVAVQRAAAAGPPDPLRKLERGALAFLNAAREPTVRQIVLVDGPSVLGWDRWREIDSRHHLRPLKGALIAAMRARLVERRDPETLARLVMGALTEAALDGSREMADSAVWLVRRLRR